MAKDSLGLEWYSPWRVVDTLYDHDATEISNTLALAFLKESNTYGRMLTVMILSE